LVQVLSTHEAQWLRIPAADREAWTWFRHAAAMVIAHLERDLRETSGIGYSDFDVLMQLSLVPGTTIRMADLARKVSLSPSALTRLVQRLERRGFVKRRSHRPTVVDVSLTAAGLQTLSHAAPPHLRSIDEIFWAPLTRNELTTLTATARKIATSARPKRSETVMPDPLKMSCKRLNDQRIGCGTISAIIDGRSSLPPSSCGTVGPVSDTAAAAPARPATRRRPPRRC